MKRLFYLLLMAVFGCLGPVVRAIGFPVAVVAWLRACIASVSLIVYILVSGRRYSKSTLISVLKPMSICGVALAGDWIGLFAAYNYTTVANATVCYYITPILVLIGSAVFFKEKFTLRHTLCAAAAFIGMFLVSGVTFGSGSSVSSGTASGLIGLGFALIGAVSYTLIVLINRRYPEGDALLRSTIQLTVTAVALTPYVLLTEDLGALSFSLDKLLLLLLLGVLMTAGTYIAYFYLIVNIPSRTVAILAYADPLVAVLASVFFLGEPMSLTVGIGSTLIIGAAVVSEMQKDINV